jgi:WD40 repeat protein
VVAAGSAFTAHIALFFSAHNRWSAGVGYFIPIPLITVMAIFGPGDGRWLAVGAADRRIRVWDSVLE